MKGRLLVGEILKCTVRRSPQIKAIAYDSSLTDDGKAAKYQEWFTQPDKGAKWLHYFEAMLERHEAAAGKETFIAGTVSPTHADYLLFDLLDTCEGAAREQPTKYVIPALKSMRGLFNQLPRLKVFRARISTRPRIAAYLASPSRRE
jgi:hypothetical protein